MATIYTLESSLILGCNLSQEGQNRIRRFEMKTKTAFFGIIASLVLFVGIVISGVYVLDKFTNTRSETPMSALNTDQDAQQEEPKQFSQIQQEIIEEVFEQLEDQLYDTIVKLDNSKAFVSMEDEIMEDFNREIDHKKKRELAKKLGDKYIEDMYAKALFKIRRKVDGHFDDEYVDEIVQVVMEQLKPYRTEVVRRYVLDNIYSRVSDEILQEVALDLVSEAREDYAKRLKEEAIKQVDEFVGRKD